MWGENYKRHIKEMELCRNQFVNSMESVKTVLPISETSFLEAEWGIPKGKRMQNETKIVCAKREFTEETNIVCDGNIQVENNGIPFTEQHTAINGKTYVSVYYLAKYIGEDTELYLDSTNLNQVTEIDAIRWCSLEQCLMLCREYYTQKMQCLIKAHRYISGC
jgi:8-oxo-dGTP pyrophosphatase MutT (NUDIX family)